MAGLDPAIHPYMTNFSMDARERRQVYVVCEKQTTMLAHDVLGDAIAVV